VPTPDAIQEAAALARQQVGRLADRLREAARGELQAPAGSESPWNATTTSPMRTFLAHLLALHEAGLITDAELAAKRAALEDR
jgi:hypothetical protein